MQKRGIACFIAYMGRGGPTKYNYMKNLCNEIGTVLRPFIKTKESTILNNH